MSLAAPFRRSLVLFALVLGVVALGAPAPADAAGPVTIYGPANVYAQTSCQVATWSVSHTACPSGQLTFRDWFIDGSYAGSGLSVSQTYCPQSPATAFTVTVEVDVRCGRGFPLGTDTHSTFVSLCDNSGGGLTCVG